jgi:hypothetical protein
MKLARSLFGTLVLVVLSNSPILADDSPKTAASTSAKAATAGSPKTATFGSPKMAADGPPKTGTAGSAKTEADEEVKPQVVVFRLRFSGADQAAQMLKKLGYGGEFVADPRTNSLIANAFKEDLSKLETLLKAIDRPSEVQGNFARDSDAWPQFRRPPINRPAVVGPADEQPIAARPSIGESAPENIRMLRQAFHERDAQAARTAAELARLRQLQGADAQQNPQLAQLMQQLRQQVQAAYDARRQLQVAEVDWLRQRLARIERELSDREQIKQQIIERRVEELLNPGLQWVPSNLGAAEASSGDPEQKTMHNLRQLSEAMRNYHDVFHHFPKAATTAREVGHKSETPHSWRIDLLPFVGAANLYQQYQMDEPWDGPNNKQLLDRMPAVFRSPYDDPKSTSTAYAVLVGKGTVFEPGEKGINIPEITDGTSNTILVVEARRNCPWMKPEDIPFDADKPVPELGGFVENKFAAALADGSVHVFDRAKIEDILPWMILRNDQHAIKIPFKD